jgi:hypothetical protein
MRKKKAKMFRDYANALGVTPEEKKKIYKKLKRGYNKMGSPRR